MACLGYKGCELAGSQVNYQGGGKPHPYILVLKRVFYAGEFVAVVAVVAYIRTVTVRVTIWSVK